MKIHLNNTAPRNMEAALLQKRGLL